MKKDDMLEKMNLSLVKSYNDLLRLFYSIAQKNNLTFSKKEKRFMSIDRKSRRILLNTFNNMTLQNKNQYIFDDLEKNRGDWIRFFETIHPS